MTTERRTPRTLSPQAHAVLQYLRSGKGLSNLLAINTIGIGSLSSRVAELREKGFRVETEWHQAPPPAGNRYAVYKLKGSDDEPSAPLPMSQVLRRP